MTHELNRLARKFLAQRLVADPTAVTPKDVVAREFEEWCRGRGDEPSKDMVLAAQFAARDFAETVRPGNSVLAPCLYGVAVRESVCTPEDAFVRERLLVNEDRQCEHSWQTPLPVIYEAYRRWCGGRGLAPMDDIDFRCALVSILHKRADVRWLIDGDPRVVRGVRSNPSACDEGGACPAETWAQRVHACDAGGACPAETWAQRWSACVAVVPIGSAGACAPDAAKVTAVQGSVRVEMPGTPTLEDLDFIRKIGGMVCPWTGGTVGTVTWKNDRVVITNKGAPDGTTAGLILELAARIESEFLSRRGGKEGDA